MSLRKMLVATLAFAPVLPFALASVGHFGGALARTDQNSQPIPCEAIDSVGRASMSPDGTITLQLRSLWPDPIAETQLVFAPDDPQYADIKRHLGGIAPGENKPVPPWCGMNSEP